MGFSDLASSMFSGMGGPRGRRGGGWAGNGITTSGNIGLNFSKEFNPEADGRGQPPLFSFRQRSDQQEQQAEYPTGRQHLFYNENNSSNTRSDKCGSRRFAWNGNRTRSPRSSSVRVSVIATAIAAKGSTFNTLSGNRDTVNIGESDYLSDGNGYNLNARIGIQPEAETAKTCFSGPLSALSDSYNKGLNRSDSFTSTR